MVNHKNSAFAYTVLHLISLQVKELHGLQLVRVYDSMSNLDFLEPQLTWLCLWCLVMKIFHFNAGSVEYIKNNKNNNSRFLV
jgi:hypothetical protein